MKILTLIRHIQEDRLTNEELIHCLEISHTFVLANAIRKIVQRKICDGNVIDQLEQISRYRDKRIHKLVGVYTLGHLAIAALFWLGAPEAKKKHRELWEGLEEWDREVVGMLLEQNPFV